jgi:hypothetical protein
VPTWITERGRRPGGHRPVARSRLRHDAGARRPRRRRRARPPHEEAAAASDLGDWLTPETPLEPRIRALMMAADHERPGVIDELLAAGTPIDATDAVWGRQAMRVAREHDREASIAHLSRAASPRRRW